MTNNTKQQPPNEIYQEPLDAFLEATTAENREKALKNLIDSIKNSEEDKDVVASRLEEELDKALGKTRSWIVWALAKVGNKQSIKVLEKCLDQEQEASSWVRFWAVGALVETAPNNLERILERIYQKDDSIRVRAVALNYLIEYSDNQTYLDHLQTLLESKNGSERWSALRALYIGEDYPNLPKGVDTKVFVEMIGGILKSDDEWEDIRRNAALVLGKVEKQAEQAILILCEMLRRLDISKLLRHSCIGALLSLNNKTSNKFLKEAQREVFLWILQKVKDNELHLRAADALHKILGTREAVQVLIDEVVENSEANSKDISPPRQIISALNQIDVDDKHTINILREKVLSLDPDVSKRAANVLASLGGEKALRTMMAHRRITTLKDYTEILNKADRQIMGQFDDLIGQAKFAFNVSMGMHIVIFVVGIIILGLSFQMAMADPQGFRIAFVATGIFTSLALLLTMFYKDPLKNIGHSVHNLVKVNIVFLGYVRQINQIDASFKQLFLNLTEFDLKSMKETVEQVKMAVDQSLKQVREHLNEPTNRRGQESVQTMIDTDVPSTNR